MNQIHINCKFNLRKKSSIKPMPIYLVAYISGKQYKVATGVKVLPFQWDKHRQMAIVSNIFSEIDNYNNTIANEKLSVMRDDFDRYLDYLCTHQENNPTDLFRQIFCKGMAKNVNNTMSAKEAIKIIIDAFSVYYQVVEPDAKESTIKQQRSNLNKFFEFVQTMDKVIIKELLSQKSLNDFREYMQQNNATANTINNCGGVISRLINRIIAVHNDFLCYGVAPVNWIKAKNTRKKEDNNKHFPLYENEIQAIKECKTLTKQESEYRTLFLLGCATGLRVGDLLRFARKEYKERQNGYYVIETEKNGNIARVQDNAEIDDYLKQVGEFTEVDLNRLKATIVNDMNRQLKTIAKKCGLNRVISGITKEKEYRKPIHELLVSHCARYTFVRNMCVSGMSKEDVILLTGHADTKMIDEIYLRYSSEDIANKLNQAFDDIEQNKESKPEGKTKIQIDAIKELQFAFSDIRLIGDDFSLLMSISPIRKRNIRHRITGTMGEIDCLAAFNSACESERAQFIDDVKSLNEFYFEYSKFFSRPELYNAYLEKAKFFGISVERLGIITKNYRYRLNKN